MERLGKRQATTPHKTYIPYSRRSGESKQYPALRKWPRNLAFSTAEATWEVQARVQRLLLSEPFDLAFSFLFHGCELRKTGNSFTVIASAVHDIIITRECGACSVAR